MCKNLQNKNQTKITGSESLHDWAKVNFQSIDSDYCEKNEHKTQSANLKKRNSKAKVVKNTQQYHCFDLAQQKLWLLLFAKVIKNV